MKSITDISSEIYPLDFDLDEAKEKGIADKETYERIQKHYLIYFSEYLNGIYDFYLVDKNLNSEGFEPTTENSYYLEHSKLGSEYIYLRNNVHCERLTEEQIKFLRNEIEESNHSKGLELVKETYKEVLSAKSNNFSGEFKLSYENTSALSSQVKNTSLVFYVKYKETKADNDHYWEKGRKEGEIIENISTEIKTELGQSIDVEINIFNEEW